MYKMHKVSELTVYQSRSNLSSVTLSDCFLAQPWNLSASHVSCPSPAAIVVTQLSMDWDRLHTGTM